MPNRLNRDVRLIALLLLLTRAFPALALAYLLLWPSALLNAGPDSHCLVQWGREQGNDHVRGAFPPFGGHACL